jgi:acyl carrier protein
MSSAKNGAAAIETIILEILSDVLEEPVDVLRAQPILAVYEWDSITSLLTLSQLESQFGVTLDLRAYHATRTVGDLVDLIAHSAATSTTTP